MNIWLINHYAVPPQYYPLSRPSNFAKYLMRMGHTVTIFAASTVHNSEINLIESDVPYREDYVDGIHYVYIRCRNYQGNGMKRILNMCEFARKLPGVCRNFERPDVIVATSVPPMSCAEGIRLSKKYRCKGVAEIADLWPESIVAYGIAGPKNPAVLFLRRLEKWIYTRADAVVFTMGGGYDYIRDQGWEKDIPETKVTHINNGVDLEAFDYNKLHFQFADDDLDDPATFKVVYTGSLRQANEQIYALFDAIRLMQGPEYENYRFLIYGKGDLEEKLRQQCRDNGYTNVRIKGFVEKKYIPFILSKCDVAVLNCASHEMLRYGGSQNKLFDYLAAGIPIISGEGNKYSIVRQNNCGIAKEFNSPQEIVDAIIEIKQSPSNKEHIRAIGEEYSFETLTKRLLAVIEKC